MKSVTMAVELYNLSQINHKIYIVLQFLTVINQRVRFNSL